MFDYAEKVMELREAAEKSMCGECGLNLAKGSTKKGILFSEAADAIEELLAELATIRNQLPRWVSVEDELPKLGERVLITNGSFVCESYQSQGKRWMRHGCYMDYMQPTHWMPLPAPPKGVE